MTPDLLTPFWGGTQTSLLRAVRPQGGLLSTEAPPSTYAARATSEVEAWAMAVQHLRSGGGLAWRWERTGTTVNLHLAASGGAHYEAPATFTVLRGTGEASPLQHIPTGCVVDLAAGDHVILPVSPGAAEELDALLRGIMGLGPDHRVNLFHALRRPSLDARVDRLERALDSLGRDLGGTKSATQPRLVTPERSGGGEAVPFGSDKKGMAAALLAGLVLGGIGGVLLAGLVGGGLFAASGRATTGAGDATGAGDDGGGGEDGGTGGDDGGTGAGGTDAGGDGTGSGSGSGTGGSGTGGPTAAELEAQARASLTEIAARVGQHGMEGWAMSQASFKDGVFEANGEVRDSAAWGVLQISLHELGLVVAQEGEKVEVTASWDAPPLSGGYVVRSQLGLKELLSDQANLDKLHARSELATANAALLCETHDVAGLLPPKGSGARIYLSPAHTTCDALSLADAAPGLAWLAGRLPAAAPE